MTDTSEPNAALSETITVGGDLTVHRPDTRVPLEDSVGALVEFRDLVLAWLLARSPAMLVIPGTGTVAHVDDNIAAAAISFSTDDIDTLTAAA